MELAATEQERVMAHLTNTIKHSAEAAAGKAKQTLGRWTGNRRAEDKGSRQHFVAESKKLGDKVIHAAGQGRSRLRQWRHRRSDMP
ncbi:CsbD family protein [Rhodococcus zopfii]|uniref:CsbD family protein n=1 Tax=Rhodococcus zopfii TaxID=43772 RepID=A0ABU3WVA3_9NOCA|nr:CsbD family protein [Rhodococcus zopfii]MDV2477924.1 CsbD family protein [Rhodococcus zopfii]